MPVRALGWLAVLGLVAGIVAAFGYAPRETVQGNVQRIMYLHVPAVLTAYLAFGLVFVGSVGYLLTRRAGWDRLALAAAEPGVIFTGITIASGSIWGKPTWGTWWVWDARLTSELILLFLYGGFLALVAAIDDPRRADRAGALLAIVGSVNIPIIYFSVVWWNTLHQGASVNPMAAPKMAAIMLQAMLLMTLSFWAYAFAVIFVRARAIALERDNAASWAGAAVGRAPAQTEAVT